MGLGAFCPLPLPLGGTDEEGITAEQFSSLVADLLAAVRTAPFAVFAFSDTTNKITSYQGQNGAGLAHAPTVAIDGGTGAPTFTWDAAYTDAYDNSYPVNILAANAQIVSSSAILSTAELVGAASVEVRAYTAAGTQTTADLFVVVY